MKAKLLLKFGTVPILSSIYIIKAFYFNFVPAPSWADIEQEEWQESAKAIRRIKWHNYFGENVETEEEKESGNNYKLPAKLKVQKWSVPDRNSDATEAITSYIEAKIRTIEPLVNKIKPNLNKPAKKAIIELIKSQKIFCRSDKDGKTIILEKADFISICEANLGKNVKKMKEEMKDILLETKKTLDKGVQKLYKNEIIDKNLLFHAIGQYPANESFSKTRKYANQFSNTTNLPTFTRFLRPIDECALF